MTEERKREKRGKRKELDVKVRRIALIAGAAVAVTVTVTVPAVAQAAVTGNTGHASGSATTLAAPQVVTHVVAGSAAAREAAMLKYWTPQRMEHAISRDGPSSISSSLRTERTATTAQHPEMKTLASSAAPTHPLRSNAHTAAPLAGPQAVSVSLTTAITQGKVFGTLDGQDYVCSAGTVNSPAGDMVFTAGHCVSDGNGNWATNWVYVPAYYYGQTPYGMWAAKTLTTFNAFRFGGDLNYDVGVVNVTSSSNPFTLVQNTGGNGLTYDANNSFGYTPNVTVWGYPATNGFNGEQAYYCSNVPTFTLTSLNAQPQGPLTQLVTGCAMQPGASGGPWLVDYNASTELGNEDALTSTNVPAVGNGYIGSPYFGSDILTIYQQTENN
jgi:V8-like Glu-specific endopeptidase